MIGFFAITISSLFAQDYLIDFSASGDTNVVVSVKVDNLTSGESLILNGNEILHLIGSVGIAQPEMTAHRIAFYPNPVSGDGQLTVRFPQSGKAKLEVIDQSGRSSFLRDFWLTAGIHWFSISGMGQGLYTLRVEGAGVSESVKCISVSQIDGKVNITKVMHSNTDEVFKTLAQTVIEMPYEAGDQLLFKGVAGTYSTLIPLVVTGSQNVNFNFVGFTDADGNKYTTVFIGQDKSTGQTWITDNLIVTHYRNGDPIDYVTDDAVWFGLSTGAYCWYNNDEASYKVPYGALYNGYAVSDSRNLCPAGWHVPSSAEWNLLINFLGGMDFAGGKLKTTGTIEDGTGTWHTPNLGATNETGFSGHPAGIRHYLGYSEFIGSLSYQWSSTIYIPQPDGLYCFILNFENPGFYNGLSDSKNGQSVRCVMD